jgi:hypothetical protein
MKFEQRSIFVYRSKHSVKWVVVVIGSVISGNIKMFFGVVGRNFK